MRERLAGIQSAWNNKDDNNLCELFGTITGYDCRKVNDSILITVRVDKSDRPIGFILKDGKISFAEGISLGRSGFAVSAIPLTTSETVNAFFSRHPLWKKLSERSNLFKSFALAWVSLFFAPGYEELDFADISEEGVMRLKNTRRTIYGFVADQRQTLRKEAAHSVVKNLSMPVL